MIVADTDEQALNWTNEIIAQADTGAIGNILASANLDTNTEGTADQLKASLEQSIEEGNIGSHASFKVHIGKRKAIGVQIQVGRRLEIATGS